MSHTSPISHSYDYDNSTLLAFKEHVQRVRIEPERTGWARISDLLRQNDEMAVQDVKEDIDTLLVFAGLFSAVITAFVVESYHDLKEQPEDSSNAILLHISLQLSSLSISGNNLNSTAPPFSNISFQRVPSSVRINSFWSLSLAISLITASLGMLVKQWLREFLARNTQNPKEQVKIRTYRHAGVKGLSEFLRELDPVVGWITTSVVLAWLVVFLFTTFAPLIYSTCPYKTPILRPLFSGTRKTLYFLISKACHYLMLRVDLTALPPTITHKAWLLLASWVERTRQSEELGACRQWSDLAILVSSVDHLRGERLEDTIIQCSRNYTEDQARLCVDFMARHLGQPQTSPNWLPPSGHHLTISKVCVKMLNTEDGLFWVLIASRSFLPAFQALHQCIASAASNTWEHSDIEVSRSAFRRLTHRNPNTAVLALLSVYRTIRERIIDLTAVNDPQSFHWVCHPQNDAVAGGIIVNLVEATRTLLQIVWDDFIDPHDSVHDCIDQARVLNPSTLQKDAIVMISAFAAFCWLASPTDVQHHADILNETLEELANILEAQDLESINDMHAYCLENACRTLAKLGLTNTRITNRMENIVTNRPLPVIQFHLP